MNWIHSSVGVACLLMRFPGAVSQYFCLSSGAWDPLALHRLDHKWVLESQRADNRGSCLLKAAAVPNPAGAVHSYLSIVQVLSSPPFAAIAKPAAASCDFPLVDMHVSVLLECTKHCIQACTKGFSSVANEVAGAFSLANASADSRLDEAMCTCT